MDLFSLENKTAIVTGACGLLGTQHCEALAQAGAQVVVADLDEGLCGQLAERLGEGHLALGLDVTSRESLQDARQRILNKYGRIDVLVNNAAINDMFENPLLAGKQSMFEHYPLEMWDKSWKVNVSGVFLCSQVLGGVMAEQGGGSIINIASTYGIVRRTRVFTGMRRGSRLFINRHLTRSPNPPSLGLPNSWLLFGDIRACGSTRSLPGGWKTTRTPSLRKIMRARPYWVEWPLPLITGGRSSSSPVMHRPI